MSIETGERVSRVYGGFRGVDFRGEEINLVRSPDSLNVWKDYKHTESIRTRPAMKLNTSFSDTVYGIFFYKGFMIVHSGSKLYKVSNGVKTEIFSGVRESESNAFIYENIWYFKDGKHYVQYDGETVKDVEGYIPTTSIGRRAQGGGTTHEEVNMLSDYRINTFLADGEDVEKTVISGVWTFREEAAFGNVDQEVNFTYAGVEYVGIKSSINEDGDPETIFINSDETLNYVIELMGGWNLKDGVDFIDFGEESQDVSEKFIEGIQRSATTETGKTAKIVREGSTEFWLDYEKIDSDFTPTVTITKLVEGKLEEEAVTDFTVDFEAGKITFAEPPLAPYTDGQDNITVKYKKAVPEYRDCILKCTLLQVFDNRVFFSGNPDHKNTVWHCSLNDPSYCSDLDYYREGMDEAQVKGMVAGNNALWVFREPSEANTNVFYHTPALDEDYGKIYPSSHSSITIGCVGKAINFNDDIVFFSERGMEGISGDVTTEQVAAHRSTLVDRKLISETNYSQMLLEEWEGYLLIFIGDKVYLADSRAVFTNENHIEYEFFYWELEKTVTSVKVFDGVLYVGTADGVYTMSTETDENGVYIPHVDITSYWTTPKDKFKAPNKLKTTNKRGCVVEATGDVSVYVKTENTDFELIEKHENVTDCFVSRIKRKKFKDIQLKFHSNTRFSLETVTLEAFIGGYIKR